MSVNDPHNPPQNLPPSLSGAEEIPTSPKILRGTSAPPVFEETHPNATLHQSPSRAVRPLPEPFTNRIVTIHVGDAERIVGVGCRVDDEHVLTSGWALVEALKMESEEFVIWISIPDQTNPSRFEVQVLQPAPNGAPEDDVAVLRILEPPRLPSVPRAEFATPLTFKGKPYSTVTFTDGMPQAAGASLLLDAPPSGSGAPIVTSGLVSSHISAGSPVWSSDLEAFVGILSKT